MTLPQDPANGKRRFHSKSLMFPTPQAGFVSLFIDALAPLGEHGGGKESTNSSSTHLIRQAYMPDNA